MTGEGKLFEAKGKRNVQMSEYGKWMR